MQQSNPVVALFAFLLALGLALVDRPAVAGPNRRAELYQYTTSFSCGIRPILDGLGGGGNFETTVSLLNTGLTDATIHVSLALTQPPIEPEAGGVSSPLELMLAAGRALQIDCPDIRNDFVYVTPLSISDQRQGFVLIESDLPLDAEATHTVSDQDVSIDVERLTARRVPQRPVRPANGVTLCHVPPGNPSAAHTITVGSSAVAAHRGHGDSLGACAD